MSDKQALIAMFDRANVKHGHYMDTRNIPSGCTAIIIEAAHTLQNDGYSGFFTVLTFDASDNLFSVGSWE